MNNKNNMFPLLLMFQVLLVAAQSQDFNALMGLKQNWGNKPLSWVGTDPCDSGWDGIGCNNLRVISITLASANLTGSLSSKIQLLSELQTLDLSFNRGLTGTIPIAIGNLAKLKILILVGCDFFGTIPDTIGFLRQLTFLALNNNWFNGNIPRTIGNLSNLEWLDLSDNQLEGSIPVSDTEGPGLDMMLAIEHFHFGNNKLSGEIPTKLFQKNMRLLHVLLDSNQLNGSIPSTLTLVRSLEVLRFDRNKLTGPVPANINTLTNLNELFLSNNNLNGSLPNLTGLNHLTNVDLSNNSFISSDIPSWASNLPSLTTLKLESTRLQGLIPSSLFNQSNLESVDLRGNYLNGTLDIGSAYSKQLQLIDLVHNSITDFKQENKENNVIVILVENPVCLEEANTPSYCKYPLTNPSYSTPSNNCSSPLCSANQISSPNCICAFPYIGNLSSRAIGISNFKNLTYYLEIQQRLMENFQSLNLPVDSIALSDPLQTSIDYFQLSLKIFPSQSDRFNITGLSSIVLVLTNQIYEAPDFFSPYFFSGESYKYYAVELTRPKSHIGVIVGAVVGVFSFIVTSILLGMYALRQKKRAERAIEMNPFAKWELNEDSGAAPQLKGARWFSFEELKRYSNNFSQSNTIGCGGYGEVYLGTLPTRELVAIKRAKQESIQGATQFKTEIELLSRVHHKNLVGLVGFCYERGEQMLVYEYVPNGTLSESLSGKSGIRMDWMRRLRVALDAAKGLAYLHELANPPIIHRDIKTGNILLDEHLNAKVADFGISKLVDSERGHITTQVKGTKGYLDPEYYMTQLLTEKSDVYNFGVVMLELVIARRPIEQGKYIVREVLNIMDRSKYLYNLKSIIDPIITKVTIPKGLEKFVDLALRCVEECGANRPTMAEVVKGIENIMELAGLNSITELATTSESYEEVSSGKVCHPYNNEDFYYSGIFSSTKVEAQ